MLASRQVRVPAMVRGTVMAHRRRCGKANCRCASDAGGHQSMVLCYSEGGSRTPEEFTRRHSAWRREGPALRDNPDSGASGRIQR